MLRPASARLQRSQRIGSSWAACCSCRLAQTGGDVILAEQESFGSTGQKNVLHSSAKVCRAGPQAQRGRSAACFCDAGIVNQQPWQIIASCVGVGAAFRGLENFRANPVPIWTQLWQASVQNDGDENWLPSCN